MYLSGLLAITGRSIPPFSEYFASKGRLWFSFTFRRLVVQMMASGGLTRPIAAFASAEIRQTFA